MHFAATFKVTKGFDMKDASGLTATVDENALKERQKAVSENWARQKEVADEAAEKLSAAREELLKYCGPGYNDENVSVVESKSVDTGDPRVLAYLKINNMYDALTKPATLDPTLVKKQAEKDDELKRILDETMKKTVTVSKPKKTK